MFQIKPISKDAIPGALDKAKHYRLLNEPWQAESICRDILMIDPDNQSAILSLMLSITDQFGVDDLSSESEVKELCAKLTNEYERKYYRGLIEERLGKAALKRNNPRVRYIAFEYYRRAMKFFEDAEKIRPEGNQESVLRWNACVRYIQEFNLEASPSDDGRQPLLDV